MKIELRRLNDKYKLEAKNDLGKTIILDNSIEAGGDADGFRPMQTLLAALGACSSIDIISILKKQRLEPFDLSVEIEGERETGKDANLWKTIHAKYIFSANVPKEKAERAVELSLTKYCSVSQTLKKAGAEITFSVEVK